MGTVVHFHGQAAHALAELFRDPPRLRERRVRNVNGVAIAGEMTGARAGRQLRRLERRADFRNRAIARREARELVDDVQLIHVAVDHAAGQPIRRLRSCESVLSKALQSSERR